MANTKKNLYHTILAIVLGLLASCTAQPLPERQAQALLKWEESLGGTQSIISSWVIPENNSTALNPCQWRGIKCNNAGNIAEINLGFAGLQGPLEHLDFSSFPELLRLGLQENQLNGTIPTNISMLSKLQVLDLSKNSLTGMLPISLANLTKLEELDLSRNELTGELYPGLFPDGTCQSKTGLISLRRLHLRETMIGGRIPSELGNMKNLIALLLDRSSFFGPLPPSLGNLSHLEILRLNRNKFSGLLPEEIGNLSSLVALHLSENFFTGQLPQQVCRGGKLKNLTASSNNFSGPIPVTLKNCPTLYRVRLQYNQLTGNLDTDFGVYPNLTYIDLSYNRLQGNFSSYWGECRNLTMVDIAGNMINGKIPDSIGQFSRLGELDLSYNQLSGEIPAQLGQLSGLSSLKLKNNKFSGHIPVGIVRLSNLRHLHLSSNMLNGPIPDQIGDCIRLLSLNLSDNCLNGTIPERIGALSALQNFLDLSYNLLSGEIPSQLGDLRVLENLNLSHNNLTGRVPDSLGRMPSLSAINLSYNTLEGPLPDRNAFRSFPPESFTNNKDLCSEMHGLRPCNATSTKRSAKNKEIKVLIIVVSVIGSLFFSILVLGCSLFYCCKYPRNLPEDHSPVKREKILYICNFDGKCEYEDIINATEDFNDSYCIGEGGSSKVYKAELPRGEVVAVKRPRSPTEPTEGDMKTFKNEITTLTEIRHQNIVRLYGFSHGGRHSFLVYELMVGGNLAEILSVENEAKGFDWGKRVEIVKGVAYALSYMHHDCVPPIIHRDISTKNILLNSKQEAQVSDFGTAKFLKPDSSNWTSVAGTYGYIAPELCYTMVVTEKCDVYSFGVLALEVLMGSHPWEFINPPIQLSVCQEIQLHDMLDPRLSVPSDQEIIDKLHVIMKLSLSCLCDDPRSRPTMRWVCQVLERRTHDHN